MVGCLDELDVVQSPSVVEDDEYRSQDEDVADARDNEGLHAGVGWREHLVGRRASEPPLLRIPVIIAYEAEAADADALPADHGLDEVV
jgi:hypothetical protein